MPSRAGPPRWPPASSRWSSDGTRSCALPELHALLARTADAPEPDRFAVAALADPADVLPSGRDRDGHDAKCGYGRLDATRACAAASDPLSLALTAIGEDAAATAWCLRERPYSPALARWAVCSLLARPDLEHAVRAIARHARLVAVDPTRARAHAPGALARQLGLIVRELARRGDTTSALRAELEHAFDGLRAASGEPGQRGPGLEKAAQAVFDDLWGPSTVSGSAVPE